VDGGINLETGKQVLEADADVLVAGNFLFNSDNLQEMIHKMKLIIND
jgi:ribulose-phosphate 3-epimerase